MAVCVIRHARLGMTGSRSETEPSYPRGRCGGRTRDAWRPQRPPLPLALSLWRKSVSEMRERGRDTSTHLYDDDIELATS